ncbi:hypothetical protein H6G17_08910 [Chroococcidiopsis sp. FACHB-1243]|uniref:DUF6262 family protein n=1 Tax=Chroococcidiopsis sp. [FACHB-1243] TaxID=2692781 RepID=UPI00177E0CF6|nr:DUF6262 family protein [Chroococcidiopsis sp. [FACHB-1243]]MBD2305636.1 hypothetical protein [Chroococcidiopsis sp. [FACHB-1243]]
MSSVNPGSQKIRSQSTKQRVLLAIGRLEKVGAKIGINSVAKAAGVSASYISKQPELKQRIQELKKSYVERQEAARSRESFALSIYLSQQEKEVLERIALEKECHWGDRPSVPKLLEKIANREFPILQLGVRQQELLATILHLEQTLKITLERFNWENKEIKSLRKEGTVYKIHIAHKELIESIACQMGCKHKDGSGNISMFVQKICRHKIILDSSISLWSGISQSFPSLQEAVIKVLSIITSAKNG